MAQFVADGEFGVKSVEADSLSDAAQVVAELYAGLDSDEVCRDPFWFTVASAEAPLDAVQFRAEWSPEGGLKVELG